MDTRRNRYDRGDSLERGDEAEDIFVQLAEMKGWKVTKASAHANIHQHWDFLIEKPAKKFRVDVKARKKIRRIDSRVQDTWFWVELHGVRNYDRGWLYDGKADLIAVEKIDTFVIVKHLDLIALVEQVVDPDSMVSSAKAARYKVYSRSGRSDRISMIRTKDLEAIRWDEW